MVYDINRGSRGPDSDPDPIPWSMSQQRALKRGTLSQTRVEYMGQLFGESWTTIGKEI